MTRLARFSWKSDNRRSKKFTYEKKITLAVVVENFFKADRGLLSNVLPNSDEDYT